MVIHAHPRFCTADVIDRPWRFNHLQKWKFYVQHYSWLYGACAPVRAFSIQPSRRRWQFAHAALLGMLASGALAAEHDHAAHGEPGDSVELAPMVITGVAQQSPLTVVTDPKIPASRCRPAMVPTT